MAKGVGGPCRTRANGFKQQHDLISDLNPDGHWGAEKLVLHPSEGVVDPQRKPRRGPDNYAAILRAIALGVNAMGTRKSESRF